MVDAPRLGVDCCWLAEDVFPAVAVVDDGPVGADLGAADVDELVAPNREPPNN